MIPDAIISKYLSLYARRRKRILEKVKSDPSGVQKKALQYILDKAKDTAIGNHFGFKEIKSVKDYQRKVPLMYYDQMKPWIDGCLEGRPDHIWPGRIKYFALSSGTTTGKSKYIPLSNEIIKRNRQAGLDCISFYLNNTNDTDLFKGKLLFLGGSTSLTPLKNGISAGDMSGVMSKFIPFYARHLYEPGRKIALIPDWEVKIASVVERLKDSDVRLVCGIPPWLLILFEKLINAKGREKVCDVWQNFSLLIHGGLDFSPYESLMRDLVGKDLYYMETYFASEALIGIQDRPSPSSRAVNEEGLLLMLDYGIFYEFVKAEELDKDNPVRYTVSDIELDTNYAIAITNINGLYSYFIGDTVKFVAKDPLRIKVTGRTKDYLSALGEHVIGEEVEYAMSQALSRTGATINNYTVAPHFPKDKSKRPGHQWLVEFSKRPADADMFMDIIDAALCKKNRDYETRREKGFSMAPPLLYELKKGTFYKWHKSKGQLGGQHKTPRLRSSREIAEELIKLNLE